MDPDVLRFLEESGSIRGENASDSLRRVLHLGGVPKELEQEILPGASDELILLFNRLDLSLRLRNPGLHYVRRSTYLGYRREGSSALASGERSQVFASVMRHSRKLIVVMPLNPAEYEGSFKVQDLRGRGHHGVGELKCALASQGELDTFLATFDAWLTSR